MRHKILIYDWLKTSFIDYPLTISTVIYLRGCNLRCPYCHNPILVEGNYTSHHISIDTVIAYITKRSTLIDGIVITGGEPTCYPYLEDLIAYLKTHLNNIKIKIDTNGLLPHIIEKLKINYCALDIKAHPKDYPLLGSRMDQNKIEKSLLHSVEIIKSLKENGEVRITSVAPFISTNTIEYFKKILKGVHKVYLQPFIKSKILNPLATISEIKRSELLKYKEMLEESVDFCEIRDYT